MHLVRYTYNRSTAKVYDTFLTVQYMSMLVALIITELITAAVGGLMTFRILSGLEERLINKLAEDYGHEPTSDIPFSHSLDFAQYKVKLLITPIDRLFTEVVYRAQLFFGYIADSPSGSIDRSTIGEDRNQPLAEFSLDRPTIRWLFFCVLFFALVTNVHTSCDVAPLKDAIFGNVRTFDRSSPRQIDYAIEVPKCENAFANLRNRSTICNDFHTIPSS